MRIGEFALANDTSIDTIRHYMDLGLIVPERQGTYFYFDERCKRDYERVVEMKDMGFSLVEIRNILMIIRFSKMASGMEIEHYRNFFQNKLDELAEKRDVLNEQIQQLEDKIRILKQARIEKKHVIGWGLEFLASLQCPICQSEFTLAQASIEQNAVKTGVLTCQCGHRLQIDEGILIDPSSMKKIAEPDESYFIRYIKQNSASYLNNIYKTMEWGYRHIDIESVDGKTVLELGVGNGIFLSHIIKALPATTRYIAVDYDLNRLRYLKKMLERVDYKAKVVFVCADFKKLPLRDGLVEFVVDFYGSTSYHFNETVFLHRDLEAKYAKDCGIMGIFMCFDRFKKNSKIAEGSQYLFKQEKVKDMLASLGFEPKIDTLVGFQDEKEHQDEFFEITNRILNYGFYGGRVKKEKPRHT
jgi:DNA-binding transcriptional MerR regulator/predicted RNA methylase